MRGLRKLPRGARAREERRLRRLRPLSRHDQVRRQGQAEADLRGSLLRGAPELAQEQAGEAGAAAGGQHRVGGELHGGAGQVGARPRGAVRGAARGSRGADGAAGADSRGEAGCEEGGAAATREGGAEAGERRRRRRRRGEAAGGGRPAAQAGAANPARGRGCPREQRAARIPGALSRQVGQEAKVGGDVGAAAQAAGGAAGGARHRRQGGLQPPRRAPPLGQPRGAELERRRGGAGAGARRGSVRRALAHALARRASAAAPRRNLVPRLLHVRQDALGARRAAAGDAHPPHDQHAAAADPRRAARVRGDGAVSGRVAARDVRGRRRALLCARAAPVHTHRPLDGLRRAPGHRGLPVHRVHGRGQADARRARLAALPDAPRGRASRVRVRRAGGQRRRLSCARLPRLDRARRRHVRAPQDCLLLPREHQGRAPGQARPLCGGARLGRGGRARPPPPARGARAEQLQPRGAGAGRREKTRAVGLSLRREFRHYVRLSRGRCALGMLRRCV
mmetsp:Transcript_34660/g.103243  ORF Transcript_34660/g.103243 Transcript_34660/m.103243 type:complete len:509 (+) Transcript_34660:533-2059(+)